jgi:hypothetical protein
MKNASVIEDILPQLLTLEGDLYQLQFVPFKSQRISYTS